MGLIVNHNTLYKQIYQKYMPRLVRFALRFVDDTEAEDLVQDVFLKYWDKGLHLFSDEEVSRILYTSVRNACIDRLRHKEYQHNFLEKQAFQLKLDELNYYQASDKQFMQKDLLHQINLKITELPEKNQEIFRMAYIEGMHTEEIAECLGLSTRTVENQLYRALKQLRKSCSDLFLFLIFFI
jgi:RNA polymerase sigma-70 factor (ECF subfamily)